MAVQRPQGAMLRRIPIREEGGVRREVYLMPCPSSLIFSLYSEE